VIGLPTLAQLDAAAATAPVRIWLASEPADMRCGLDRLAELARTGKRDRCGTGAIDCRAPWLSVQALGHWCHLQRRFPST
jgi:hypothetical protein